MLSLNLLKKKALIYTGVVAWRGGRKIGGSRPAA